MASNDTSTNESIRNLDRAATLLREAKNILFITGAGISADSGLPTYRGMGGIYDNRATDDGITIEEALSIHMFRSRPEITWKYLRQIEVATRGKTFNSAHAAIATIERQWPRVWTLTQNIDGFHRMAGSKNVIEIHGTMRRLRCLSCATVHPIDDYSQIDGLPQCFTCGQMARPDVVLFGEMLPAEALRILDQQMSQFFDLVVSVGTSSVFPYILEPIYRAQTLGIPTIEINPAAATDVSSIVDVHLKMRAAPAFETLSRSLKL